MNDGPRCCGSGTCIIDLEGRCWCGQQWDGEKMCQAPLTTFTAVEVDAPVERVKSAQHDDRGNPAPASDTAE